VKTTIELPDHLLAEAKQRALDEKRTLKDVFGSALEQYLHQSPAPGKFELKMITTKGPCLVDPSDWETIRDMIYPYPFPMHDSD
jgi:hypothetical protein